MPMEMLKALARLAADGSNLAFGHEVGGDDVGEASALHVLHDDPKVVLPQEAVDVIDDIGVAGGAHDEDLVDDEVLLRLLVEVHLLDGDGEVGADLVGGVDTTAGALTDLDQAAIEAGRVSVGADRLETLDDILAGGGVLALLPPAGGRLGGSVLALEFRNGGGGATRTRRSRTGRGTVAVAGARTLARGRGGCDAGRLGHTDTSTGTGRGGVGGSTIVLGGVGTLDIRDGGRVALALCLRACELVDGEGRLGWVGVGRIGAIERRWDGAGRGRGGAEGLESGWDGTGRADGAGRVLAAAAWGRRGGPGGLEARGRGGRVRGLGLGGAEDAERVGGGLGVVERGQRGQLGGDVAELVPDLVAVCVGLLVEFDDLHNRLRVLLLLLAGDPRLLEELLPLLGHPSELSRRRVEADVHEVDWVVRDRDFWTLGGCEEVYTHDQPMVPRWRTSASGRTPARMHTTARRRMAAGDDDGGLERSSRARNGGNGSNGSGDVPLMKESIDFFDFCDCVPERERIPESDDCERVP
jgi:hypothetical protein